MSWPNDYIEGTARVLPTISEADWTSKVFVLSDSPTYTIGDVVYNTYPTIAACISAGVAEILVVPTGTEHQENISGPLNIGITIVAEDPGNKPEINFVTSNQSDPCPFYLFNNGNIYDLILGLSSNWGAGDCPQTRFFWVEGDSRIVGCVNGDISLPMITDEPFSFIDNYEGCIAICCGIDLTRNISLGGGSFSGGFVHISSTTGYALNCTFPIAGGGFSQITGNLFTANCVGSFGDGSHFYAIDPTVLSFLENGFIIDAEDGNGLPLDSGQAIQSNLYLSFELPAGSAPGATLQIVWHDSSDDSVIGSFAGLSGDDGGTAYFCWSNPPTPSATYYLKANYWNGSGWEYAGYTSDPETLTTSFSLPVTFTDDFYGVAWNDWDRGCNEPAQVVPHESGSFLNPIMNNIIKSPFGYTN